MSKAAREWLRGFLQPGTWQDIASVPISLAVLAGLGWGAWSVGLTRPLGHWWRCNSGTPGFPAWAPNGTSIAFGEPTSCGTSIATVSFRTGTVRKLTFGRSDGQPAWSPNGQTILYSDASSIRILDVSSRRTRVLIHCVDEFGANWSPDGKQLAYTHGFLGGPFDIPATTSTTTVYVADINGAHPRHLLGHDVNGGTPAWSPDGYKIAVVAYQGVYIVNSDGSGLHRILSRSFDTPGTPAWAPDARTIAFIGSDEIETIRSDGRSLKTIARCTCDTQTDSATWSPDGRWIAFSAAHGIYLVHPDGTHRHRLVRY